MGKTILTISSLMILSGIIILFFIYTPVLKQELNYRLHEAEEIKPKLIDNPKDAAQYGQSDPAFLDTVLIPVNFSYSLVIPKLGINTQVIADIDSGNPDEYLPALQKGAAHAKNSALPDEPGPTFIFGHSTDSFLNITSYNAIFFLLYKLEPGDDIYVFYNQRKYHYQVTSEKVVKPEEVSSEVAKTFGNDLILQTCSPPGTTLKRLLVFAKPV